MALDKEIQSKAETWANDVFNKIKRGLPENGVLLKEDAKTIFEELKEWGLTEKINRNDFELERVLVSMLAKEKYKVLKYAKDHPPRRPLASKWEKVTGMKLRTR